jgi:thiamine biosynthesis lipoprotein
VWLLFPVMLLGSPAWSEERVQRHLLVMGTVLTVEVEAADRATALAASEAAVRAVAAVERRLSSRGDGSELERLATAPPGSWQPIGAALARDLALAQACHRESEGGFDITLGQPDLLELDGQRARVLAPLGLDAGGFGKGLGLDEGLAAAVEAGARAVSLDLGGQIASFGAPVEVGLAHPRHRQRGVTHLWLEDASIATSGQGVQPGHIRDPIEGGAAPAFGSVSVIAPSAARADCLATGLFVLGPDRALSLGEQLADVQVIVQELGSDGLRIRRAPQEGP